MRTGTWCKKIKPLSEFYYDKANGRKYSQCRTCSNMKRKERYYRDVEETRRLKAEEARRNYNPEKELAKYRKRYAEHPEQCNARTKLQYAIKTGRVIKPDSCSQCGSTRRVSGHHEDYSKPLEVIWLCQVCHSAVHAEGRAG